MQKELSIMPREDKPNARLVSDDHRFHMFTDDVRSGARGEGREPLRAAASPPALLGATHTVIVQLMLM